MTEQASSSPTSLSAVSSVLSSISGLSAWQTCMRDAIVGLQAKGVPYEWASGTNNHSGTSRDLVAGQTRIAKAAKPPKSYCCGATFEAFWDGVCAYAQTNPLSADAWKKAYAGFFRFSTPDTARGVADGLALIQDDLRGAGLVVREVVDPLDAPPFSFVQIQFSDDPEGPGHSAVIVGKSVLADGRDCLVVWSSAKSYQASVRPGSDGEEGLVVDQGEVSGTGYGLDYFVLKPRSGSRSFFVATCEEA